MIELSLIKLFLKADEQHALNLIGVHDFPKELQPVYSVLKNFVGEEHKDLSVTDLANLYFASSNKDKEFYVSLFNSLETLDVSNDTTKVLLNGIVQKKKLKELSVAAYEVYEGQKDINDFLPLIHNFDAVQEDAKDDEEFISDDLEQLLEVAYETPGLRWRLKTLNKMMGSLRPGNFGFIFARPETGKTTLLASEVSFMCEQLDDDDGPIIWVANEEPGVNVKLRVYQAWFGIDLPTLLADKAGWAKKFQQASRGKVLIPSRQNLSKTDIEKLCKKHKPSLVILDQLSKVTGFEEDRKDLELGAATTWARDLSKQGRPVIATHQADGNAEGVMWLNMGHVANAKTAMQADADWILGVGKQNKDGYETIRYLHLSKNKLLGDEDTDPQLRHGKVEVLINPMQARYEDLLYKDA